MQDNVGSRWGGASCQAVNIFLTRLLSVNMDHVCSALQTQWITNKYCNIFKNCFNKIDYERKIKIFAIFSWTLILKTCFNILIHSSQTFHFFFKGAYYNGFNVYVKGHHFPGHRQHSFSFFLTFLLSFFISSLKHWSHL
jgi:hypothetical protein